MRSGYFFGSPRTKKMLIMSRRNKGNNRNIRFALCAQPVPKAYSCVPMVASGKAERLYFFHFCGTKKRIYQARNWFKIGTGGLFISLLGLRPGLLNVTRLQALFYEAFQHFSHGFQKSVGMLRSKKSIEVESSPRTRNCYSGVTGGTGTL